MNQRLIDIGVESYRAFAGKFQSLVPDPNSLLKVSLDDCLETSFWETDTPELQLLGSVFSDLLETLTVVETPLELARENLESGNEQSPQKTNVSNRSFGSQGQSELNLAHTHHFLPNRSKKENTESKAFSLGNGKSEKTQDFGKREDYQDKQGFDVRVPIPGSDAAKVNEFDIDRHHASFPTAQQNQTLGESNGKLPVSGALSPMIGKDAARASEFDIDSHQLLFPAVQNNQTIGESNEQLLVSEAADSDSELINIDHNPESFQVQPFTSLGNLRDIGDLFGEEEASDEKLPAKVDWIENKQSTYPPRPMPSFTTEKTEWQDDLFDQKTATNFSQNEKTAAVDIDTLLEILAQNLQNDYERYYGD